MRVSHFIIINPLTCKKLCRRMFIVNNSPSLLSTFSLNQVFCFYMMHTTVNTGTFDIIRVSHMSLSHGKSNFLYEIWFLLITLKLYGNLNSNLASNDSLLQTSFHSCPVICIPKRLHSFSPPNLL